MYKLAARSLFSTVTTPMSWRGCYSFLWIALLILDLYLIMVRVKQRGIKHHFWVFGMTQPGIESRCPGPLVNSATIMPTNRFLKRVHIQVNRRKTLLRILANVDENIHTHKICI